ncbi:Plant Tudor-like RNA-binding protein [Rhynchospora pubera]|uniref:Plant Tudor-like RNA-binding protein n=1 Tax=Rhynchospora pubera TaxID=906938 RepID=A0AAV8FAB0_9POAL|nr:Plant Tudor-like RNA-binding protein [Rhynchospora pubera]
MGVANRFHPQLHSSRRRLINSAMPKIKQFTRFNKGSQVEVFCNGRWRPAEIVCGNGRTYSVRYNYCPRLSSPDSNTVEVACADRVPRKALRPPPPVKVKDDKWVPGDLAEVLVHGSWIPARVTGVAYGNEYFFVSLSGTGREVAVKKLNLRKQRVWDNGKWVTISKDSGNRMDTKKRKPPSEIFNEVGKKQRISKKVMLIENYRNSSFDNVSTLSSTGSCSTSGRPYQHVISSYVEDDDAMSSFVPENGTFCLEKEKKIREMEREAHKVELDAYHATVVALHANGCISWEQEAMLSNLRLLLNISNDEQQSVLRSLGSSR